MEKIKVKFVRSHPDFGHFVGDEVELSAKQAEALLESKHVEAVKHKAETAVLSKAENAVVKEDTTNAKEEHHAKKDQKK